MRVSSTGTRVRVCVSTVGLCFAFMAPSALSAAPPSQEGSAPPSQDGEIDDVRLAKRKRRKAKAKSKETSAPDEKAIGANEPAGQAPPSASNTAPTTNAASAKESSSDDARNDDASNTKQGGEGASAFDDEPLPFFHSFRRASGFGGKVGSGLVFLGQQDGIATGYAQMFGQVDGQFGDSGFGIHVDADVRLSSFANFSLFEPRLPTYTNGAGEPVDNPADAGRAEADYYGETVQNPSAFYRQPGTFNTGRTNDYLRIQSLNITYDSASFGGTVGRMFIVSAAQAQVDGVEGHFVLNGLGSIGAFGGLKPNPWHQQVVGASSGGFIPNPETGELQPVRWGTFAPDPLLSFAGGTQGAYSNEIGLGYPWTQFLSLRHATVGTYGNLRLSSFWLDAALVGDFYTNVEFNPIVVQELEDRDIQPEILDRVWVYTTGGVRLLDGLTASWRGTVDLVGARVLTPRDAYVDVTWRDLGPVTLSATYYKVNTYATASSFFRFFQPLEQNAYNGPNPDAPGDGVDFNNPGVQAGIAAAGINNTQLFLVDRDRLRAEIAVEVLGAMQVYGRGQVERRADAVFIAQDIGAAYGAFGAGLGNIANTLSDPGSLCFVDAEQQPTNSPQTPLAYNGQPGSNVTVPVNQDLCRWGGSVGIRDPFLANIGSFDLRLTHMNGYFQSTTRVGGNVGAGLFGSIWLQVGGSIELNTNERTYGVYDVVPEQGQFGGFGTFYPTVTNVYAVNTAVTWNVFDLEGYGGLFLEGAYAGFIEDLPYQGVRDLNGPYTGEKVQVLHNLSGRAMWRF